MSLQGMNHFTVLSDNLQETRKFYCDLLGFEEGPRPNFRFPGYWLYVGDQPILHVIHRDKLNEARAGVIDHMAFTATDLPGTVAKLEKAGVQYELRRLPQGGFAKAYGNCSSMTRMAARSSSISTRKSRRRRATLVKASSVRHSRMHNRADAVAARLRPSRRPRLRT